MKLGDRLDQARAEVARLEREAAQASCLKLGRHTWKLLGGANCGCHAEAGCSVPVYVCTVCGDCDYGQNREAKDQREQCEFREPAE